MGVSVADYLHCILTISASNLNRLFVDVMIYWGDGLDDPSVPFNAELAILKLCLLVAGVIKGESEDLGVVHMRSESFVGFRKRQAESSCEQ